MPAESQLHADDLIQLKDLQPGCIQHSRHFVLRDYVSETGMRRYRWWCEECERSLYLVVPIAASALETAVLAVKHETELLPDDRVSIEKLGLTVGAVSPGALMIRKEKKVLSTVPLKTEYRYEVPDGSYAVYLVVPHVTS